MDVKNILIVGVGGQGILLASELLSEVAFLSGCDVKKSEVHGMAQRGGVVSSHVRYGKKVYSPLIKEGDADVLLAFEMAEALRWSHFVRQNGVAVINEYQLIPPVALIQKLEYPENPVQQVKKRIQTVVPVSALKLVSTPKVVNIFLLGVISNYLNLTESHWLEGLNKRVPRGTEEMNRTAFNDGRAYRS